eukprot:CAMPEP_0167759516 /NCGR_PEP_ID=MMETSP0110_2-20121227/11070_1 /TAXON_ID=629695 /ORGANISM="Gymnochlora sp., Strain CCMP2014" /LENGTH=695 /DNA_ID=CAMNT_0007645917 /DNA_START=44 /DNA_END=2131 /DNA_ORIENTATION=-
MSKMPWGIKRLKPGVHKTINAEKLKKFDRGYQPKRNKYKMKKMQEEAKRKRAQEEAAKVYESFVESFQVNENDSGHAGIGFVEGGSMGGTGGTARPSKPPRGGLGFSSKPPAPSAAKSTVKRSRNTSAFTATPFEQATSVSAAIQRRKRRKKGKKKSNMQSFLEELKRESALKEERKKMGIADPKIIIPIEMHQGHHDTGDPTTTNIYVGNISPQISEEFLVREFGKYGDIASVKIMWPRTPEEHNRHRNCGFVSFMKRADAEEAIKELQGKDYFGFAMRLGWGKKVILPSQPLRIPKPGETLAMMIEQPLVEQKMEIPADAPKNKVIPPPDPKQRSLIDRLARFVATYGHIFEKEVMQKEVKNPKFFFLYQAHTPQHIYYRWRVYMLSQGDTEQKWRTEPFQMLLGGPYWMPPSVEEMKVLELKASETEKEKKDSQRGRDRDSGRDHERRRSRRKRGSSRRLRSRSRDEFEDRLRGLSLNRTKIAYGMGFALDHADEAKEIVEIITESLSLDETPIPKKVARLFLVSDILYNSTAPVRNASAYRSEFKDKLPKIFESLHRTYKNIQGRITANAMRERITKVLRVWQVWSLFPETFVNNLEVTFLGKEATQKVIPAKVAPEKSDRVSLLRGAYESDDENDQKPKSEQLNSLAGLISTDTDDIDGAPIEDDIDGEPLDDVDGEPLDADDIDGVPIA